MIDANLFTDSDCDFNNRHYSTGLPDDVDDVLHALADASGPLTDADIDALWIAEQERRDAEQALQDARDARAVA